MQIELPFAGNNKQQSTKINAIIKDLRLIQEYARPTVEERLCAPKNLRELGNLLKAKNCTLAQTKEQREQGQDWLQQKGVDLSPLVDKVRTVKEYNYKHKEQRKVEQDSYFYFPQVTIDNQDQYLNKATQFGMFSLFQDTMSNRSVRKQFTARMMRSLVGSENGFVGEKQVAKIKVINTQVRKPQKKVLYVNCLKFITDENISDYLQHIKDSVGSAFWEIVQKQLKEVDPHSKLPMRSQVLFNALRVVEAEFDKSLPTNSESIHYYLNNYYLSKMGNQHGYQRDSDSGAFWGKAFLLYRAGRKEKFYKLLENDQTGMLLKEFVEVDQAIARKESKISTVVNATEKDVFYDQLIYALRGEHKFSSSILCSKATLDIVWLLLRTAGIFANSYQYFVQRRKQLIDSYKNPEINTQELLNMLHLLAYDELIKLGPNILVDADDYVHFLIALEAHESLLDDVALFRKLLTEHLVAYIYELMAEDRKEYIYYMLHIPKCNQVVEISSILSSNKLLASTDWLFFKRHMETTQLELLMRETLQKHVKQHHDYLVAAEKMLELLGDQKGALDLLLQMLIRSVLVTRFDSTQLEMAQQMALGILLGNDNLQRSYGQICRMLSLNRILTGLIIERNEVRLQQFLRSNQQLIDTFLAPRADFANSRMFEYLGAHQAMEVYFIFVRNMVKAVEITHIRNQKPDELFKFQSRVLQAMNELLKTENRLGSREESAAKTLIEYLTSSVWETNH